MGENNENRNATQRHIQTVVVVKSFNVQMDDSFIDYISVLEYEIKVTLRCNHYKCMKAIESKPRTKWWLDLLFACLHVCGDLNMDDCVYLHKRVFVCLFVYFVFLAKLTEIVEILLVCHIRHKINVEIAITLNQNSNSITNIDNNCMATK